MYFLALASDYDGTLATEGAVFDTTLRALDKLKDSGRKVILVTGRELPDLKRVFPRLDICDLVVAENGALLYFPQTEEERPIAAAPPPEFVERLKAKGVERISVGRSIVATWEPHENTVLETIKEMGLGLDIIFNKGAVMILPNGVNKASGLEAALAELGLSAHNVVAVGDAENDHAFMRTCGASVAVANALPAVKDTADFVSEKARGAGVEDLIDVMLTDESRLGPKAHQAITIGSDREGMGFTVTPDQTVLIAGSSGIGKSTLATAMTEKFVEAKFQFVVFDPEGDYDTLEDAVSVGDTSTPPSKEQVLDLLNGRDTNVVVNALALQMLERPGFFADLQPGLNSLRARTGRPHWLIIDEAHHLMPAARDSASLALSQEIPGTVLITVHPESVSADALSSVDVVLALGPEAGTVIETVCKIVGEERPHHLHAPGKDEILFWSRGDKSVHTIVPERPRQVHKRHTRKYAEGSLPEERSFYFRGPEGKLNLRAHNLMMFLQIAEGVDAETWTFHRGRGDYSAWFRDNIKDDGLAEEAARIEGDAGLSAEESRGKIAEAVQKRYTGPASGKD
jgi:phosphoglycolate phosphatase (TIGR01487 family)